MLILQLDGEEDKGLDLAPCQLVVRTQGRLTDGQRRNFVVGQLKKESTRFPAVGLDLAAIDRAEFRLELLYVAQQDIGANAKIGSLLAGIPERCQ